MIYIEALEKIFADNSDKSAIAIKSKCEDCGCEITVDVTPTPEGFGFQGGVLLESVANGFLARCLDCYKTNPKIPYSYESTS